jgi:hypothetical protein
MNMGFDSLQVVLNGQGWTEIYLTNGIRMTTKAMMVTISQKYVQSDNV